MFRYIKFIPFLMMLLLFSCNKEETTFIPTIESTQSDIALVGIILDADEEPIEGAEVSFNGKTVFTTSSGSYDLGTVSVDSKHNFISIKKDGYFESGRTFRSKKTDHLIHQTVLTRKEFDNSFQASSGGTITKESIKVEFNPGSITYDDSGNSYDGEVMVAISYLNTVDQNIEKLMPGDLTSLSKDNTFLKSTSYGMVYVELQSPAGKTLQLKEGTIAKLSMDVSGEILSNAPQTLQASYFDEKLGLWRDESNATLTNNTYVAEVSHFSCWSYNSSSPSIIMSGRVIDAMGLPVSGLSIQVTEQGIWSGGYGYTDENGEFTGAVAMDATLNFSIHSPDLCFTPSLYSETIGPFNNDINIGDKQVDISSFDNIQVIASFYNCDNEPVTNGLAYVARSYFKITDGTIDVTVPVCSGSSNHVIWVQDLDTDKTTGIFPLLLNQVNNYVNQTICNTESPFLEIISQDLGLNERTNIELISSGPNSSDKFIDAIYIDPQDDEYRGIRINFNDNTQGAFAIGTWNLTSAQINMDPFNPVAIYTAQLDDGEVTVVDEGIDALGAYFKGSYRIDFTDVSTGTIYEVHGDFKLR